MVIGGKLEVISSDVFTDEQGFDLQTGTNVSLCHLLSVLHWILKQNKNSCTNDTTLKGIQYKLSFISHILFYISV